MIVFFKIIFCQYLKTFISMVYYTYISVLPFFLFSDLVALNYYIENNFILQITN